MTFNDGTDLLDLCIAMTLKANLLDLCIAMTLKAKANQPNESNQKSQGEKNTVKFEGFVCCAWCVMNSWHKVVRNCKKTNHGLCTMIQLTLRC